MNAIKAKARGEPKQIFELVLLVAKLLSQPDHVVCISIQMQRNTDAAEKEG